MRNYVIPSYTMLEGLHPSDTFCNFLLEIRRTNPARGRHNLLRGLRKLSQSPSPCHFVALSKKESDL
jgi:hypothetical protein